VNKNRLFSNASMSVLQVLVASGSLFFLYKILLNTIGVKQLGVWSVVMATSTLTQIANPGFGASTTKFVSKYLARGEEKTACRVIETSVVSLSALMAILLIVLYPIIKQILHLFIADDSLNAGLSILPYAFVTMWITFVSGVFQAGLDGYQRIDSKNLIIMTGTLIYVGSCALFSSLWGLVGVAFASILQSVWVLAITWIILKRRLPILPVLNYKWDRTLFKEILNYGVSFQFISITGMLSDPLTKVCLSKFGSLSDVAYYEMANRMVQQVRSVLATPGYILVPAIADLKEREDHKKIESLYLNSYNLIFSLSVASYTLLIIYLPVISKLWIGHIETAFVTFSALLSIGWFCNLLAIPSYYANLGTGEMRWNVIGHVSVAILNPILSFVLGWMFGGVGVVYGWVISIVVGNFMILLSYQKRNKIGFGKLIPLSGVASICLAVLSIVSIYGVLPRFSLTAPNANTVYWIVYSFLSVAIVISLWMHPARKQLFNVFVSKKISS